MCLLGGVGTNLLSPKALISMARPEGFEPPAPRFVGGAVDYFGRVDILHANAADLSPSATQADLQIGDAAL